MPADPAPTPVQILTAPTASGKTGLSIALAAQAGDVEIVSADAFLVYRGLNVGTAKPDAAEQRGIPHHLIDVADPDENYDVAQYVRAAEAAVTDILARGRRPLVVGGTGFYLTALLQGLPLTPRSDAHARAALETELQARGLDALLAEIEASSPAEARRMERNPRRVLRALEVYRATGRWPGEYGRTTPAHTYHVTAFAPPQADLETRIAERTVRMFRAGWPQEAAWLASRVDPATQPRPTVWQTLGYDAALAAWRGELPQDEAVRRVTLATRQYARRQLTWMRGQLRAPLLTPDEAARQLARHLHLKA
ncbi:tRNA (adenosine(37)-N6)-dimethylallyltransferase MiaA [Deinococcus aquiradiocola]|uniref:tRNA (adenosine(37)-N6)-dimethylallyltransferase MiaA n=1 Tax=Deinococcus aquiradiocola TaxID=393059 RepID=UPI00166F0B73|nr:tRNA (adenosine(37)-N6)-dimethylallyltransferase MiaA [Deinococcus aquiradiocola]